MLPAPTRPSLSLPTKVLLRPPSTALPAGNASTEQATNMALPTMEGTNAAPVNPAASRANITPTSTPPGTRLTSCEAISAPSNMPTAEAALMNPADISWLPPWEMSSAVSSRKALLAPVTMAAAMMRWRWNRSRSSQIMPSSASRQRGAESSASSASETAPTSEPVSTLPGRPLSLTVARFQ